MMALSAEICDTNVVLDRQRSGISCQTLDFFGSELAWKVNASK